MDADTMDLVRTALAELRAIDEAATAGPWRAQMAAIHC